MAPTINIPNEDDFQKLNKVADALGIKYTLESPTTQIAELDTKDWIVFPDKFLKGKYSGVSVSPGRIAYCPAIEKVGKELGLKLKNTSKDFLGREFVGNINHQEALKINLAAGNNTLAPREFLDFLNLLYQGSQGKIKVYNKAGKQLDAGLLGSYFDDIVKVQSPWRAEHLNANFKFENNKLYLEKAEKLENKNLIYSRQQLSDWLDEDKTPGINLINLLKTANKFGLPTNKTEEGDLYYWAPDKDNNSVAGFDANSVRAYFNCYGGLSNHSVVLGVRAAKQHK